MKLTIKLSKHETQYHCHFIFNDQPYFFKTDNLEKFNAVLSKLLAQEILLDASQSKLEIEYATPLNMAEFMCDLNLEHERTVIQLPKEVCCSAEKNVPIVLAHRNLSNFKKFWKTGRAFALFEALSQDIIETPYVDAPGDFMQLHLIAYHTNHGTTHALRQTLLVRSYFEYLQYEGTQDIKEVINSLTSEEIAALELAAFLFRSGRTNEASWNVDSTYGKRSAAIFKDIAIKLKFKSELVDALCIAFDYHQAIPLSKPFNNSTLEQSQKKADLFRNLLKLSHESDLVRCEVSQEKVMSPIKETLATLVPKAKIDMVCDAFLHYAAELNRKTGSPVTVTNYQQNNSEYRGDRAIAVKSANNPLRKLGELTTIRPICLPGFISPTKAWFEDAEHVYKKEEQEYIWGHINGTEQVKPEEGWKPEQMNAIPTKACIEQEIKYTNTYVTVYHATKRESYALDLLCRTLNLNKDNICWIRPTRTLPLGLKKAETITDIDVIRQKCSQHGDNKAVTSWHLLSCNPTLWHNADYDSMESTVDYFYKNGSVQSHNFKDLIEILLNEHGLLVGHESERKQLYEQFAQLVSDSAYGNQGVIYQYSIPHELVNEIAFISKSNGIWDEANPDALHTLTKLKTPGASTPNHNTLQVRLLVTKLLDPSIAPFIKVENFMNLDAALKKQFENNIQKIAEIALNGPTEKRIVKEEPRQESYKSSALDANTREQIDLSFFRSVPPKAPAEDCFLLQENCAEFIAAFDDEDDEDNYAHQHKPFG